MFLPMENPFSSQSRKYICKIMLQRPKRPRRQGDWEDVGRPGTPAPDRPIDPRVLRNRVDSRRPNRRPRFIRDSVWDAGISLSWPSSGEMFDEGPLACNNLDQPLPPRPVPPRPVPPLPAILHEPAPGPSSISSTSNRSIVKIDPAKTNDLMNRLWSVLECPVCFEYVSPPILQCREGHLVCSGCKARLDLCPKCRQPFADVRARALEQVAEALPYPCNNSGCTSIFTLTERKEHEATCPHRAYTCIVGWCTWMGKRTGLPEHMLQMHRNYIVPSNTHELTFIITPCETEEKVFLMQCYDELFHCVMKADCIRDVFVGYVMHLGDKEKALEFDFELQFKRHSPPFTSIVIKKTTLEESPLGFQPSPRSTVSAIVISFSTLQEVIINDNPNSAQLKLYLSIEKKNPPEEHSLLPSTTILDSSSSSNGIKTQDSLSF